jgi:hypothetical protein
MICGGLSNVETLRSRYDYGDVIKGQVQDAIAASVPSYETNAYYRERNQQKLFPTAQALTSANNVIGDDGVFADLETNSQELKSKLAAILGAEVFIGRGQSNADLANDVVTRLAAGGTDEGRVNVYLANTGWAVLNPIVRGVIARTGGRNSNTIYATIMNWIRTTYGGNYVQTTLALWVNQDGTPNQPEAPGEPILPVVAEPRIMAGNAALARNAVGQGNDDRNNDGAAGENPPNPPNGNGRGGGPFGSGRQQQQAYVQGRYNYNPHNRRSGVGGLGPNAYVYADRGDSPGEVLAADMAASAPPYEPSDGVNHVMGATGSNQIEPPRHFERIQHREGQPYIPLARAGISSDAQAVENIQAQIEETRANRSNQYFDQSEELPGELWGATPHALKRGLQALKHNATEKRSKVLTFNNRIGEHHYGQKLMNKRKGLFQQWRNKTRSNKELLKWTDSNGLPNIDKDIGDFYNGLSSFENKKGASAPSTPYNPNGATRIPVFHRTPHSAISGTNLANDLTPTIIGPSGGLSRSRRRRLTGMGLKEAIVLGEMRAGNDNPMLRQSYRKMLMHGTGLRR